MKKLKYRYHPTIKFKCFDHHRKCKILKMSHQTAISQEENDFTPVMIAGAREAPEVPNKILQRNQKKMKFYL